MLMLGLRRRAVSVTFVHCVDTAKDPAIVAAECDLEAVPKL